MTNKVFLAAPISGFSSTKHYLSYRKEVIDLITYLRKNGYNIISELEFVVDESSYDSPADSAEKDFRSICECDLFLLLHPVKMQTSTLVEFGYAFARNKAIVVVGLEEDLPYLVIGCCESKANLKMVNVPNLDEKKFPEILQALHQLSNL